MQINFEGQHIEQLRKSLSEDNVVRWTGLFAFVTLDGLTLLNSDMERSLEQFLQRGGEIRWIVGIDAVTTAPALRELQRLSDQYESAVSVLLYRSEEGAIFHPKLSIFEREDLSGLVLVGSSNLTYRGQVANVELSGALSLGQEELRPWLDVYRTVREQADCLMPIGPEILEEIAEQRRQERVASRAVGTRVITLEEEPDPKEEDGDVLVRVIPRAGGRWSQVGIPRRDMAQFFGLSEASTEHRITLLRIGVEGTLHSPPAERRLVRSQVNKNSRIELQGLEGVAYPLSPPILVASRVDAASFRYLILFPGDAGYPAVSKFAEEAPSTNPGALPSVVTTTAAITAIWPDFPL